MIANIYIRKENEKIWAELEDKSEFINNLIQKELAGLKLGFENVGRLSDEILKRKKDNQKINMEDPTLHIIKTPEQAEKIVEKVERFSGYIDKSYSARRKK